MIAQTDSVDSVFLNADGVGSVDTAYISRGARGLWKYVNTSGSWVSAGHVPGNFAWVAARAVAGGVEIYATDLQNSKVSKLVDTAAIGGDLTTTGVTALAYAPSGMRYAALAFEPDTGFAADSTPYPAAPPTLTSSAATLLTNVGATPPGNVALTVADANNDDLTLTATSSNQTVLPDSKITFAGTGHVRTASFDVQAAGTATATITLKAGADTKTVTVAITATGPAPEATSHYYNGPVDLSADIDVGDGYFLGISDEVNTPLLFKAGVSGSPIATFPAGFPSTEGDFEGATRFGDTVVWTGSHGNNKSGSKKPERRILVFEHITGSGANTDLQYLSQYTRLWDQWKAWDAANGHGLGANYLKFATATVPGLIPNAPNGFNVEGLTMAPGSTTTAWFGMRAPTITGADGIERALILPVTNIDKLTSDAVDATFGQPIFLNLGGRSIRDISKNAHDQYLIEAGTGDTDDSLKNWALYTWDGNPAHDPQMVNELPTDPSRIGAWEGIASVPDPLVAGSKALLTADSGDGNIGAKSYGQYVTIGSPIAAPAPVTGVVATAKPGALDIKWDAAAGADTYYVQIKTPAGAQAPGSPFFVTGTTASLEGLTAGTEYSAIVRAQNVATRSANSDIVKATPTVGARVATTTTFQFVGSTAIGEPEQLVATVSDPNATGTVSFYSGAQLLQDAKLTNANGYLRSFPVVGGKATINITDSLSPGLVNLQAKFTTSNAENYQSSNSDVVPIYLDYKPKLPWVEITNISGDRVVGSRIGITIKLHGYTAPELWNVPMSTEFDDRAPGAAKRTRLVGDTQASSSGYAPIDDTGTATFYTTALTAGQHRLSVYVPYYSLGYNGPFSAEVPVAIAPAGSTPATPAPVKLPTVAVVLSGPGRHSPPSR